MNREILFRGKRIDNGEWVYGYLWSSRTIGYESPCGNVDEIVVGPSTIGQYTGKSDKDGVKIFEGDKVRFKRFNELYSGIVKFNQITAAFEIYYSSVVGVCGEKAKHTSLICHCDDIEIIGNIHDGKDEQHD